MIDITTYRFISYLLSNQPKMGVCDHGEYQTWNLPDAYLNSLLERKGEIHFEEYPAKEKHYSEKGMILLNKPPFNRCDIYQCEKCQTYFLKQKEQNLFQTITSKQVDLEALYSSETLMIYTEPYRYSVYKKPGGSFMLHVHKPIGGGADIIHELTSQEKQNFLRFGLSTLAGRRFDMDNHYEKYKISYWR